MSLAAVCAWSFLRASVMALVAAILSKGVASFVGRAASLPVKSSSESNTGKLAAYPTFSRRFVWALLLAPFLVPPLLVGYAYARLALLLIHYPFWNDVTYGLLLLLKFSPAAVVIRVFAPPSPVSAEAIHLARLLRRPGEPVLRRAARELGSWIAGSGRVAIGAFVVVFLLAFQEFEIASLMGITTGDAHSPVSWTVWLFDQHAGGLPLSESLSQVVTPLLFELAIVVPAVIVLPAWMSSVLGTRREATQAASRNRFGGLLVVVTALLLAGIPSVVVARGAARGIESLETMLPALREIAIGAATALGAALLACGAAHLLMRERGVWRPRRTGRGVALALCSLPGLLGPLVLSLAILGLFQLPGFRVLSESLVPLILALVLFVLPRAVILFAVAGITRRTQSAHCAWMLVASPEAGQRRTGAGLIDDLQIKAAFWSAVLVWYWCYWELTPASLLAPPSAMSFCVRLYNFMHYGQSNALSTMLLAAVAVPTLTVVVLSRLRPTLVRWVLQ
jgi:iron(III) transport system permease protein